MTLTTESTAVPQQADAAEGVWTRVCQLDDLQPEVGAAALVAGQQVALFRLLDGTVLATGNQDPFSGANVMSRGIVGTRGDIATVASPMHKQVFDLRSGTCLDDASVALPVYPVVVSNGFVEVRLPEGLPSSVVGRPRAVA
ncbi:nitrite reductase (NADH) small subunit [Motilibacter rhizosphaerae]|uniref:Nitrite reductase (NADH) small subunit n=1 Tax=Motilibacter rhizosphaerae TaxID=598652 RepID=A0A4Q7NVX5_9ACTN|nr:nitrite reductase small subunit NirD [Motilibacter rhizosphaerae]RZS91345.1 nitrite reductase (NADH) small subunit [Motilibacter rhizosphaerae]